ncbi:M28 family peptidase [Hymenobacter psychrophilus]|uniref:Peptidase family M28 n=1 Tax=Hymenobacter psychrophilus TaxID=651662 RepID=A0A1H3JRE9_9BACT|nr:M28 family peptidase [Hymenobacter psychrophilus]SDY42550.1 Peptidase family M28 [Hymenobacter psychrophilus]
MRNPSLFASLLAAGLVASSCATQQPLSSATSPTATATATTAAASGATASSADLPRSYAETITQADLRQHLTILASDEYEGRETGEKGQKMAMDYLAKQFADLGLQGPVKGSDNPYIQHFTMVRGSWADGAMLKIGIDTYKWLTDFYALGGQGFATPTVVQPVFAGYGIEQDDYSDYKALGDVQGKDLLIMLGEPQTAKGTALLGKDGQNSKWGQDFRAKLAMATQKGARSVFFVDFDPNSNFSKLAARMTPYISRPSIAFKDTKEGSTRPTAYFVSPAVGYKLLGTNAPSVRKYAADVTSVGKPVFGSFKPAKATVLAPRKNEDFVTENVMGYLEGTDRKEELMILSAHYDHIGIINGEVHNGADDDGSGTVTVLEMAQAFQKAKAEGHGPRRSILFLAVTGEEKGLLGSEYYTDHPVFPLESTVVDLNTDMVGRTDKDHEGKSDYVYVIGSDKLSSELHTILQAQNEKYVQMDLDFRFNDPEDPNRFYYRSDHYNFAKHGIPVAFFFNGVHADYHGAGDEVEKIEFPKMEKRARLVFYTAWDLANRDKRIVVDSNKK